MKKLRYALSLFLVLSCQKSREISIPREGLIAHFPLDGTAYDEINNLTAVNHHVVAGTDHHGKENHGMYFSQVDSSHLDFGNAAAYSFPQNIFTFSCWVLVTDTFRSITILSKRNVTGPFEYSWDNHMNLSFFNFDNWIPDGSTTVYGTDPLKATIPIAPGIWRHIAIVADGTTIKSYLNGSLTGGIDSLRMGHSFSSTESPLILGVGGGYGKYYYFNGTIDELLIYNRALSLSEIQILSQL